MNAFSRIWEKLKDRAYRDAFVTSQLKRGLPTQIRAMLKDRGWTQAELAQRSGLKQGVVSRASDPDYGNLTINTILKIASGFDVAYMGRFVPFSGLAGWYADLSESVLSVPSFSDDHALVERPRRRVRCNNRGGKPASRYLKRSRRASESATLRKPPESASTAGNSSTPGPVLMRSNDYGGQHQERT